MSQLTKTQLETQNQSDFPNNNSGAITPAILRGFNTDMIDSLVDEVSYNIDSASFSGSIAQLQQFSSSLDATFATDAQLTSLSASIAVTDLAQSASIAQLQSFSSSLDATFATDAQLTALSTSIAVTDLAQSASIAALQSFSSSLDNGFVSEAEFGAYTSSNDSKVNSLISKTGSYATTGSNSFIGNQTITGALTASTAQIASINYPTADGVALTFLQTDGAGNLSFDVVHTLYEHVRAGENITKGDALYVSGALGDNPIVYKADASNSNKMPVTYIASETVAANTNTLGITLGQLIGIDLTGFPVGTALYVDGNGTLTATRPTGSADIVQPIAFVTKTGNGGQLNILNPGPVLLPNIQSGYTWVGNGTNQPTAVATSSFSIDTSSFAKTNVNNSFDGTQTFNNVIVNGTASVAFLDVTYQSSSIIYSSGSNQLGDASNDIQTLFGQVDIKNNLASTGSISASQGFFGNLQGTASYATEALTASFALNTNLNTGSFATTGSNTFTGTQTLTNGDLIVGANPTTGIYNGLMLDKNGLNYTIYNVSTSSAALNVAATDGNTFSYSTELLLTATPSQLTFQDFSTGTYAYNTWLTIPQNTGGNPAPQFKRGLGVTGSVAVTGNTTLGDATSDTTTINGSTTINGNGEATVALNIVSGSVEVVGPRGNGGHFYTNLPITSSEGRINGTFIAKDLIVSGTWGSEGSGSLTVEHNTRLGSDYNTDTHIISGAVSIEGSLTANGMNIINQINTLIGATGSYAKTNTANTFTGNQTITGQLKATFDQPSNNNQIDNLKVNNWVDKYGYTIANSTLGWQRYEGTVEGWVQELYTADYAYGSSTRHEAAGMTWEIYPSGSAYDSNLISLQGNSNGTTTFKVLADYTSITGSVAGNVSALSISSNTASLNLNTGNFFTIQLVSGSATHINPSNIKPGQTINIRVNTTGSATVSFPSSVKQVSGSSYTPTTTTGVDILTLVSFDSSTLYLANVKNLV